MSAIEHASELSPDEAPSYTPVSALAATGFIVAILGGVTMAGMWLAGRYTGKPVFSWSLLLLPAVGFVLGICGYRQVTKSEGTRTGKSLAHAALWIAGLSGVCYLTYLVSIEMAMRTNAASAFHEWVARVKEGPPEVAMLAMLDAKVRSGVDTKNPDAIRTRFAREWQTYNNFDIVRPVISRSPQQCQASIRGIKDWTMDQGGYIVQLLVTLRTPEGKGDYVFPVYGRDTPELATGRSWTLMFHRMETTGLELTELGRLIFELQIAGRMHLLQWVQFINDGKLVDAYTQTLPLDQRTPPPSSDSPAFKEFVAGSLIRMEGKPPTDEDRAKYGKELVGAENINPMPGSVTRRAGPPMITYVDGRVRLDHTIEIKVSGQISPVVAHVITELQGEKLLSKLNGLNKAADWQSQPTEKGQPSGEDLLAFKPFGFRILEVNIRPSEPFLAAPNTGGGPGRDQ